MMASQATTFRHVICPVCDCFCNDIHVTVADNRIQSIENACSTCKEWFQFHDQNPVHDEAVIDGQPAKRNEAVDEVARHLGRSKFPLFLGINNLDVDGQRALCALADEVGGVIDGDEVYDAMPAYFPNVGSMGCTWGEVVQRADLIICWNCDFPVGFQQTDLIIELRNRAKLHSINGDFESIWALRALIQNRPAANEASDEVRQLAAELISAKYAVIVHLADEPNRTALSALATDVNRRSRCRLFCFELSSRSEVSLWQCGYDRAVGFHRGHSASIGNEFSGRRLLDRQEADFLLTVDGSYSPPRQHSSQIAHFSISIGRPSHLGPSQFVLFTSVPGFHSSGTVFRPDGVAVPLQQLVSTSLPSAALVLNEVREAVRTHRGSN